MLFGGEPCVHLLHLSAHGQQLGQRWRCVPVGIRAGRQHVVHQNSLLDIPAFSIIKRSPPRSQPLFRSFLPECREPLSTSPVGLLHDANSFGLRNGCSAAGVQDSFAKLDF
jgi:hypothetical protein